MGSTVVHAGYDGLDLSYPAFLPEHVQRTLAKAKHSAQEARSDVPVNIGGLEFLVKPSGSKGGYQYTVDTGLLGAIWMFKEKARSDPWGCRVSFKSFPLAIFGLEEMKKRADVFLQTLGVKIQIGDWRLSRVDFAADFLAPELSINADRFICHSRANKTEHGHIATHRSGRTISTVMIGKMPNIQASIYNKRKEIIASKKWYWWDIWSSNLGRELDRSQDVWRIEVRAGSKAIRSFFQHTSWDLVQSGLHLLMLNVTDRIRMVEPNKDTNASRWPNHPFWEACRSKISTASIKEASAVDPQSILRRLEEEQGEQLFKQLFGTEIALAASAGYGAKNYGDFLRALDLLRSKRLEHLGEELEEKLSIKRAAWKLKFDPR